MANVISTLLKLDGTQFKTGMKSVQQQVRETDGIVNKAKVGWAGMFASFASSPIAIGAATAAVGTFAAQSISAASDLEESVNAVNVVFGESADKILDFGKNAARSVGLANSEFNQLATPLGSILKNTGLEMDAVADKTIVLATRAADMASVFGGEVPDALGAIQAGLRGELDPLEKYGVKLSAATVEARALADTGKETAKELTEQEKALARVEIILEQTNQTAGDFANTSGDLANQTRTLKAEFKNLQATAGEELIPILSDLAGLLLDIEKNAGKAKGGIESIPGGKGLLDALGTNLFELPKKSKGWWDDLGRSIGVIPDKAGEFGTFRAVIDSFTSSTEDAATAAGELGDEVEDLGPRWSAASIPLEAASGAFAEMQSHADELAADIEDTGDAAGQAAGDFRDFADAMEQTREKVDFLDEALTGVRDTLDMQDLMDDITDQFAEIAEAQKKVGEDGEEGVRRYDRAVRDLQRLLLRLVEDVDGLTGQKKVEFITAIERGGVDELYRILGDLTKGVTVPVSFTSPKIPGFSSLNAQFTPGQSISAPTFNGQSAIPSGYVDNRNITIINPVGSTPTTQYVDQQTDLRRNGPR